jgi:hypothetical protein
MIYNAGVCSQSAVIGRVSLSCKLQLGTAVVMQCGCCDIFLIRETKRVRGRNGTKGELLRF